MKCALLGTGRQASRLVSAILANGCQLQVVYSRSTDQGMKFVQDNHLPSNIISSDWRQCIQDPAVEAVVVTTPDFLHYEHAKVALEAGKHVFLEKPLAPEVFQGEELISIAKDKGLILTVDYHLRWNPALILLRELIRKNQFGHLKGLNIKWGWKPLKLDDWRNHQNPFWVLSLLGTHCIDLVLWFFKSMSDPVEHFFGTKSNDIYKLQNEDHVQMTFRSANNITAEVVCTLEHTHPLTIDIYSETGHHTFDKLNDENQGIVFPGFHQSFESQNPWAEAFKDFKIAIENKRRTKFDVEDALENIVYLTKIKKAPTLKSRATPFGGLFSNERN